MRQRIHQQVNTAFVSTGWSLSELLRRSRVRLDKSSLCRKLAGRQPMKTEEAEALASALSITLVWPPVRKTAA